MRITRWAMAATAVVLAACSDSDRIVDPGAPIDVAGPKFGTAVGSGPSIGTVEPAGTMSVGTLRFRNMHRVNEADVFLGVAPTSGRYMGMNFGQGANGTLSNVRLTTPGSVSGDCAGNWALGTAEAPASNQFTLKWDKGNDKLEATISNSTISCTLTLPGYTSVVAAARFNGDLDAANAALSNVNSLQIRLQDKDSSLVSTTSTVELENVKLDGATLGSGSFFDADPVGTGAPVPEYVTNYDFDAPGGFTISGTFKIGRTGTFDVCGNEGCKLDLILGSTTSSQGVDNPTIGSPSIALTANGGTPTVTAVPITQEQLAAATEGTFTPFLISGTTVLMDINIQNAAPISELGYLVCVNGTAPSRLWHYNGTAWEDITNATNPTGKLCGYVQSFSPFAIASAKASTTSSLASSNSSSLAGDNVTLTANASTASGSLTGTVKIFKVVGTTETEVKSCDVTEGSCNYVTNTLAAGTTKFRAKYSGDAAFNQSVSSDLTQTVTLKATSIVITCQDVTFNGSAQSPCSATVLHDGTPIANAIASFEYTSNTAPGTASAKATFTETAIYAGSSASTTFTISPISASMSAFFAPIGSNNTVNAGQAIPIKFRLTPNPTGVTFKVEWKACTPDAVYATEASIVDADWKMDTDGTWQNNWKTPKSYQKSCRDIKVTPMATGYSFNSQTARFDFR